MAMNLGQAFVEIGTESKGLDQGLSDAEKNVSQSVKRMETQIKSLNEAWTFAGAGVRAIAGAWGLKEVLGVGESYEKSVIKIRYAYTENTDAMIAQAKKMSEASGKFFSFPEIADAMLKTKDFMSELGLSQTDYLAGISRAMGIAAVKGLDLESAMRLMERAAMGAKRSGTELGVVISDNYMQFTAYGGALAKTWKSYDEGSKFALRWNEIMRQTAKYQDGATVMSGTLEGALKALGNTLKAELGPEIAETVKGLANNIRGMTPAIADIGSHLVGIISTFNGLPDYLKGPVGLGIVGTILFGPKAGALLAAIDATAGAVDKLDAKIKGWASRQQLQPAYGPGDTIVGFNTPKDMRESYGLNKPAPSSSGTPVVEAVGQVSDTYQKEWSSALKNLTPEVDSLIKKYAELNGISAEWLKSVIGAESHFNQIDKATGQILTSSKGAQGIAQFMPGTAKDYGVDVTSIESSISGAARYLHDLATAFNNDLTKATAAYNAGQTAVQTKGIGAAQGDYVSKVGAFTALQSGSAPLPSGLTMIPGLTGEEVQHSFKQIEAQGAELSKFMTDQMADYFAAFAKTSGQTFAAAAAEIEKKINDLTAKVWKGIAAAQEDFSKMQLEFEKHKGAPSPEAMELLQKSQASLSETWTKGLQTISFLQNDVLKQQLDIAASTDKAKEAMEVSQLNEQYVKLTGTIKDQYTAELQVIQATEKYNEIAKSPQVIDAMRQLNAEQQRRLTIQSTGSISENFQLLSSDAINKMSGNAYIASQAFNIFSSSVSKTTEALWELCWSGKNSFQQLAATILSEIAKMIMQMLLWQTIMKPLTSALGGGTGMFGALGSMLGFGGAGGGSLPASYYTLPSANIGGTLYASGGISDGPSIFGESGPEAAVPLPDGRSIPVSLKGGGGAITNNISVTVPANAGGGNVSYEQVRKQAQMIADSIRAEIDKALAKHLRPGGMLNPKGSVH